MAGQPPGNRKKWAFRPTPAVFIPPPPPPNRGPGMSVGLSGRCEQRLVMTPRLRRDIDEEEMDRLIGLPCEGDRKE